MTTSVGCGVHEEKTAGEQALGFDTVRQNVVIPANCSETFQHTVALPASL